MFASQLRTSARSVLLPKSPAPVQFVVDADLGKPKLGGVSSFAFQGTNAHAILQPCPQACRTFDNSIIRSYDVKGAWIHASPHIYTNMTSLLSSIQPFKLMMHSHNCLPLLSHTNATTVRGTASMSPSVMTEIIFGAVGYALVPSMSACGMHLQHMIFKPHTAPDPILHTAPPEHLNGKFIGPLDMQVVLSASEICLNRLPGNVGMQPQVVATCHVTSTSTSPSAKPSDAPHHRPEAVAFEVSLRLVVCILRKQQLPICSAILDYKKGLHQALAFSPEQGFVRSRNLGYWTNPMVVENSIFLTGRAETCNDVGGNMRTAMLHVASIELWNFQYQSREPQLIASVARHEYTSSNWRVMSSVCKNTTIAGIEVATQRTSGQAAPQIKGEVTINYVVQLLVNESIEHFAKEALTSSRPGHLQNEVKYIGNAASRTKLHNAISTSAACISMMLPLMLNRAVTNYLHTWDDDAFVSGRIRSTSLKMQAPAQSLWGILRTAAQESGRSTDFVGMCNDRTRVSSTPFIAPRAPSSSGSAVSGAVWYTPMLFPSPVPSSINQQPCLWNFATCSKSEHIVTGGSGALAGLFSTWMARHRALCVHLISRSGTLKSETLNGLHNQAASVIITACNLSQYDDSCSVLQKADLPTKQKGTLTHAAGVLADRIFPSQTASCVREACAPKVNALHAMNNSLDHQPMNATILFSSVAALLGSPGQSNYAGANAQLDGVAKQMLPQGRPTWSMQWGEWGGSGMAGGASSSEHAKGRKAAGINAISPCMGLFAIQNAMQLSAQDVFHHNAQFSTLPFDWSKFLHQSKSIPPLFSEVHDTRPVAEGSGAKVEVQHAHQNITPARASLMQLSREERSASIQGQFLEELSKVVGSEIDPSQPLMEAGLDSLSIVEVTRNMSTNIGMELPATMVFDYPSVHLIAEYLSNEMQPESEESDLHHQAEALFDPERDVAEASRSIVVSAISSQWPQRVDFPSLDLTTVDVIAPIAYGRWDVEAWTLHHVDIGARFACFLENVEQFDATAFSISRTEAIVMDAQHRALLDAVHELAVHVGSTCSPKQSTQTIAEDSAVMVGIQQMEYSNQVALHNVKVSPYLATGGTLSVAAGRISYFYGLRGPCAAVDTACSSSMVGAHFARLGVMNGECSSGISCGAQLMLSSGGTSAVYNASMLTPEGRCKTLDISADGYVRGEGCGGLLLSIKTNNTESEKATTQIYLGSTSVNQDGRSSSLTAPNGPAQQLVISRALQIACIPGANISSLGMHGTGTALGDPVEVTAIASVLLNTERENALVLAAAKTYVGHTEGAAGTIGLILALKDLQERAVSPILHFRNTNQHISSAMESRASKQVIGKHTSFPCADLFLTKQASARGHSSAEIRTAGISSFAFQGTNAHTILNTGEDGGGAMGIHSNVSVCAMGLRVWDCAMYWYASPPHISIANTIRSNPSTSTVTAQLPYVSSAWLGESRASGQILFPLAALMEILSSGASMHFSSEGNKQTDSAVFSNVVMEAAIQIWQQKAAWVSFGMSQGCASISLGAEPVVLSCQLVKGLAAKSKACPVMPSRPASDKLEVLSKDYETIRALKQSQFMRNADNHQRAIYPEGIWIGAACTHAGYLLHPALLTIGMQAAGIQPNSGAREAPGGLPSTVAAFILPTQSRSLSRTGAVATNSYNGSRTHLVYAEGGRLSCAQVCGVEVKQLWCSINAPLDGSRFLQVYDFGTYENPLSNKIEGVQLITPGSEEYVVNERLKQMQVEERHHHVQSFITHAVNEAVGDEVDPDAELMEAGLDSLAFVDLRNQIVDEMGVDLEVTVFFDYRTVASLCERVADLVDQACGDKEAEAKGFAFVRTVRPDRTAHPLFLGAPAFGDGPLAYLTLIKALPTFGQPIFTLERNIELTWPQNAQKHCQQILGIQDTGPFLLGGHSLGGILAIESAVILEDMGHQVGQVFAFDAPNPMQFKRFEMPEAAEGNEATDGNTVHMETVMRSYHYDYEAEGWTTMTMSQRFKLFEDVVFQSSGRKIDAAKMVFESRFGFDMVDFGEENPDGTVHTGEWLIFKGHRMQAQLVYFRAEMTDEAAFSYTVPGIGIAHAWIWNICVDNLQIVQCQGNHFDVMLPNEEGGDLTYAIVPFMGEQVERWWDPKYNLEDANNSEKTPSTWVRGVWGTQEDLPMWYSDTSNNMWVVNDRGVLCPEEWTPELSSNYFVAGLSDHTWRKTTSKSSATWFMIDDLLTEHARIQLGMLALELDLPCFGLHLSPEMMSDNSQAEISTSYVEAINTVMEIDNSKSNVDEIVTSGIHDPSSTSKQGVNYFIIGSYTATGGRMAFHVAQQLMQRGHYAIAVLLDESQAPEDVPEFPEHEPVTFQAMYAKVCAAGKAVTWEKFYSVMQFYSNLGNQMDTLRHAYKPEEVAPSDWHSGMISFLHRAQETFQKAQKAVPGIKLHSAHETMGDGLLANHTPTPTFDPYDFDPDPSLEE